MGKRIPHESEKIGHKARTSTAPTQLCSAVQGYLKYFAAGRSNTARAKKLDLDRFLEFLRTHYGYSKTEKVRLKDFTEAATARFMNHCMKQGEASSTVARRLATVKHFGNTIASQYKNFENPTTALRPPEVSNPSPKKISKKK